MAPVHAAGDDFVVGLEKDGAIFQIIEEGNDSRLNIKGIEPEREDTGFTLAFRIEVFDFGLFFFGDGVEAWVVVEEVRHESKVELGVAGYQGRWCQEFAAGRVEAVGVLEDLFGALEEVLGLQWAARAYIGCELVEEDCVVLAVLDVIREVLDSSRYISIQLSP